MGKVEDICVNGASHMVDGRGKKGGVKMVRVGVHESLLWGRRMGKEGRV